MATISVKRFQPLCLVVMAEKGITILSEAHSLPLVIAESRVGEDDLQERSRLTTPHACTSYIPQIDCCFLLVGDNQIAIRKSDAQGLGLKSLPVSQQYRIAARLHIRVYCLMSSRCKSEVDVLSSHRIQPYYEGTVT